LDKRNATPHAAHLSCEWLLRCTGTIRYLLLGLLQLRTTGLVEITVFVIVEQRGAAALFL
jgi:hypothetical protein